MEALYRHIAITAIAALSLIKRPSLDLRVKFVHRLSRGMDPCGRIFSLNHDPLIERAAEVAL